MITNGENEEPTDLTEGNGSPLTDVLPEPSETGDQSSLSSLNGQITASIAELQEAFKNSTGEDTILASYLVMAQAAGLAMLNAVSQQQQLYILQNAITTAAAKAALEAKPEDAVKIVNEAIKSSAVIETFNGLKTFLDDLTSTYNQLKKKAALKSDDEPKPALKSEIKKSK